MYEDIREGMPTIEYYSRKSLRYRVLYRQTETGPLVSLPFKVKTLKGYASEIYQDFFFTVRNDINAHIGSNVVTTNLSIHHSSTDPLLPQMVTTSVFTARFTGVYAVYVEMEYPNLLSPYNYSNWSEMFLGYEVDPTLAISQSLSQGTLLSPSKRTAGGCSFLTSGGIVGRWSPQKLSYDISFNSRSNGRKGDEGIGTYTSQSSVVTSTTNEMRLRLNQVPARYVMRNQAVGAFNYLGATSPWVNTLQMPPTFYGQNLSDILPWLLSADKERPIIINFENMSIATQPSTVKGIGQKHRVVVANGVNSLSDVIESVNGNRFYNIDLPFILTENGTGWLGNVGGWHKTYSPAEAGRIFKNV